MITLEQHEKNIAMAQELYPMDIKNRKKFIQNRERCYHVGRAK